MYNYGNANSQQYVFKWEPTKKTNKSRLDVGLEKDLRVHA